MGLSMLSKFMLLLWMIDTEILLLYEFILGRGTVVYISKKMKLFYVLVNLEKALRQVPREAI